MARLMPYLSQLLIIAVMADTNASVFNSQLQFTIKADSNKAFDESCLIETFTIKEGNIADCLEHCLEDCRCQSFQICQNTKCQLCSSHKKENSSLLHDQDGCLYATYEMRKSIEMYQNFNDQCLGIICYMKYNCCKVPGICRENQTCQTVNSLDKPWKRFICKCPEGYHGNNCNTSITSCAGYAHGHRQPGLYKVVDSEGKVYEVFCHFDSYGAWTLVLSYSYENTSKFGRRLYDDLPFNENSLTWSGYRLRKDRMKYIKQNLTSFLFTCEYEKHYNITNSDFLEVPVPGKYNYRFWDYHDFELHVSSPRGKIGENNLNRCEILFHEAKILHVHIYGQNCTSMQFKSWFFSGSNRYSLVNKKIHSCAQNSNSTTQLWFGKAEQ